MENMPTFALTLQYKQVTTHLNSLWPNSIFRIVRVLATIYYLEFVLKELKIENRKIKNTKALTVYNWEVWDN